MQNQNNEAGGALSGRAVARGIGAAVIVLICMAFSGFWTGSNRPGGEIRRFDIEADQCSYDPPRIVVHQGDEVRIRLASKDVVHGFYMEGHDRDAVIYPGRLLFNERRPSQGSTFVPREEMVFRADRFGKYRYRCSVTCGTLHAFMQGEMIVEPNYPFRMGMGASVGILIAGFFLMSTGGDASPPAGARRLDLIRAVPLLGAFVRRRWFQFFFTLPGLGFFLLFMIAGFWGSPIGNRNIIITFVWIFWWFLLIAFLLPFGGRIWCMACPFPFFGEWLQRKRLIGTREDAPRMWKKFKKWPAGLSNIWAQNVLFLMLCTFCAILVTRPVVTASVLLGLVLIATVLAAVYRHRSFCNYLCPVSGFLNLYSMTAMVEVRSRDRELCARCRSKACMAGSPKGWGCPWAQNPGRLARNNYCGMCMECIKTCPNDNMTLKARPFCSDIDIHGADEAWKAFIMMSVALVYSVTLLGPWGTVRTWANVTEYGDWKGFLIYAVIIWSAALVFLPGLWAAACGLGRRLAGADRVSVKTIFLRYSYLLVPLGLMAWVAFSVPLIMVNVTHILVTLSDPLGWGWNLFGSANLSWTPLFPESMVYIQIPLLLLGLIFSLKRGYAVAFSVYRERKGAVMSLIPPGLVCTAMVMTFITLYTG